MIKFPPEFTATKYPGYFWNINEQRLYSIKIDGVLKPLKHQTANHFNKLIDRNETFGYRVSVKGRRRWLLGTYLSNLEPTDSTVLVKV